MCPSTPSPLPGSLLSRALGNNYLEVTPGEMNAPRIEPGGTIDSMETVTLDDLTKKIADVTDTAEDVMKVVQRDFRMVAEDAHVLLTNLQERDRQEKPAQRREDA